MYVMNAALQNCYILQMSSKHALRSVHHPDEPLTRLSQCHLGILSQLTALAELPELQAAALRLRKIASDMLVLFKFEVYGHHADEENELFPAVLGCAEPGEEADRVQAMVQRLTTEHREVEALWKTLKPVIEAATKGKPTDLDLHLVDELMGAYLAHARFEEEHFLPLAEGILGRDKNHTAALDLALRLHHAPQVVGHI